MTIEVTPADATLGATVRGVDLTGDLEDGVFDEIVAAWHEHAVLIFPDQPLDDETQVAFTRRFGPLENVAIYKHRTGGTLGGDRAEFSRITNENEDGSLIEADSGYAKLLKGNSYWHTDSSFKRVPAKASLLSARKVPATGGETEWADMRAAYDALEPAMRDWLDGKTAIHSYEYSQGLVGGTELVIDFSLLPPVEHPLIRTHQRTGRKVLYIGRHASHIVGEDKEKSRELLKNLCEQACRPPRTYKHKWRDGDLAIWDNRSVLHRGHPYPPDQLRRMVRTTVAGEADDNEWLFDTDRPANYAT